MLTQELKSAYEPLKDELYQLLVGAYSYNQKFSLLPERLQTSSRLFLLEEAIALRMMANEIVLHLCKLDDDSSSFSFRSAFKEINKLATDQKSKDVLKILLTEYRASINKFKTQHRNLYIAHRNTEDYPNLLDLPSYKTAFYLPIKIAYKVFTCIWGAEVDFGFKLSSQDREIDFVIDLGLRDK